MSNERLVYMQYLGVCSLLARLSSRQQLSEDDRECIHRALKDCVAAMDGRFKLVGTTGNGFSLEPVRE